MGYITQLSYFALKKLKKRTPSVPSQHKIRYQSKKP